MASATAIKKKASQKFLPFMPNGRRLRLIYDRDVDVLYINFTHSKPDKADYGRKQGDYILRYKNDALVGVTILNTVEHLKDCFEDFHL